MAAHHLPLHPPIDVKAVLNVGQDVFMMTITLLTSVIECTAMAIVIPLFHLMLMMILNNILLFVIVVVVLFLIMLVVLKPLSH